MSSNHPSHSRSFIKFSVLFSAPLLLAFALMTTFQSIPVEAAVSCSDSSWNIGTEADLNSAITCFNGKSTSGNYTITITGTVSLSASLTSISNSTVGAKLLIEGNGFAVDGQDISGVRPFEIGANTEVTFQNIIVQGGNITGDGGGITSQGIVTLTHSTVTQNTASGSGGGIRVVSGGALTILNSTIYTNTATNGNGGGIFNSDTVTITNSTFSSNLAGNNGGGIANFGSMTVSSSTIYTNTNLGGADSGGLFNAAALSVNNSIVAGNTTDCSGTITSDGYNLDSDGSCSLSGTGDLSNQDPLLGPLQDNGGSTLTHALGDGSPAFNAGSSMLTEDQRGIGRPQYDVSDIGAYERDTIDCILQPWPVGSQTDLNTAIVCFNSQTISGTYTISLTHNISLTANTTAINNTASGVSLNIQGNSFIVDGQLSRLPFNISSNTTVSMHNITVKKGAGGIRNAGTLSVDKSSITENRGFFGGGIDNSGVLTLTNSTVSTNTAIYDGGGIQNYGSAVILNSTVSGNDSSAFGGGIISSGSMTITQSTISGNSSSSTGGGVQNNGTMTISQSTISQNSSNVSGGGLRGGANTFIDNTIISGNINGDCFSTITSNGYNLDSDDSCGFNSTGDISGQDPLLGPLQDNGGDTFTHALLDNSPALNAGDSTLTEDQRGNARPQDGADDIGAFERVYVDCAAQPWLVSTEGNLNDAINCFNAKSVAGSYTISLTQNISLTTSTQPISNTLSGTALTIEGNGFAVDGQNSVGIRPFEIGADTHVTMGQITVTGGEPSGSGGAIHNSGILTVSQGILDDNNGVFGGAIFNNDQATITLVETTASNNTGINGGGVFNKGTATITHSTLSGNSIQGQGGGLYNDSSSIALIMNSTFSDNHADLSGHGIENRGTITATHVTIAENSLIGITNSGTFYASHSIVSGHSFNCTGDSITSTGYNLDSDGSCNLFGSGDISNQDPRLGPLQDNGPSTGSGQATFTHALLGNSPAINAGSSTLTEDQRGVARPSAGAVDIGAFEYVPSCDTSAWSVADESDLNNAILCFNTQSAAGSYTISLTQNISLTTSTQPISNTVSGVELVIEGSEFTIDGQNLPDVRPFHIMADTIVTLQNITVTGGFAAGANGGGGGILSYGTLTITHSTITENRSIFAGGGGGIESYGPLTIENSVISHNSSDNGSGIYHNGSAGLLSISNSTIKDNNAVVFGGGIALSNSIAQISHSTISSNTTAAGDGAGIYVGSGTLTVTNSTVSGNTSATKGGGLFSAGTVTILSSTFSNNSAITSGAGVHRDGGTLSLSNSIIANSSSGSNCSGTITSGGNNLDSDGSCSLYETGDISNQDPLLGPLQDNGGDTFTHALLAHSPAINAGSSNLSEDQRGVARPSAGSDDMGAYEYAPSCDASAWTVADEEGLNNAILCFNSTSNVGSYTISLTQNISLTVSTHPISNTLLGAELTIDGNQYTVDGQELDDVRPFNIQADTVVTLQNITVTRGKAGPGETAGGGILNYGTLTITDSTVRDNRAVFTGGGVESHGPLTINNSTISGNYSDVGGGVYFNASADLLSISNSTISGNDALFIGGIDIVNGVASISHTVVSSNTATFEGGGISGRNSSTITVTNSTFSANSSGSDGGGIWNTGASITVLSSTFNNNSAQTNGGGLYNANGATLDLDNSSINNNSAERGGGIASYGPLTIATSTINDNSATEDGGGLVILGASAVITNSSIYSNTAVVFGGGIASNKPLTVTQSTFYQNNASSGAGLYTGEGSSLSNSTFSKNTASVSGGAIYMTGTLTIDSGTLSGNSANSGGALFGVGTIFLQNTLLDAGATGTNCFNTVTITSNGHNLDSDGSCNLNGSGDISNQDPLLSPLQDNGGDTFTHALPEGSPAVNAGNTELTEDQRGSARPQGDADDIGAVELVIVEVTNPEEPTDPQIEPPVGSTIETNRPSFEWIDAFDENSAVVSYTLTITQTDAVRAVEATVYTFETTDTSLTVNVDLSAGNYVWSVQAKDNAGDVVAQTAEFSFVVDVDESEPTEPTVIRVYLPIMARP